MNGFFGALRKIERYLLISLMIVLIVVCAAQVFFRLVIHQPLAWTEELARYSFVWLTFIGAAVVVGNWSHFQVDILATILSKGVMRVLRWFGYVCVLAFAYICIAYGWELMVRVHAQKSAAMLIPMSIPYFCLPLCAILMIVHLIELIIKDIQELRGNKSQTEEKV